MRDHGSETKYRHEVRGWNCRLDTLQAAVLLAKLRRLEVERGPWQPPDDTTRCLGA